MLRFASSEVFASVAQLVRNSSAPTDCGLRQLAVRFTALEEIQGGLFLRYRYDMRDKVDISGKGRYFSSTSASKTESILSVNPEREFITLNNLRDNPGATHQHRRVGRGIGSGRGKTCGRGHKGQKARSGGGPKPGFEGGQTPLRLRVPKRGFHNPFSRTYEPLNLLKLKQWIEKGRIDATRPITMKDLRDSGIVSRKIKDGIKLLGTGSAEFTTPVKLQVSQASKSAREAIENCGGSITTVYYNKLGLRALLRPEWFEKKGRLLPRPAGPPPKLQNKFDIIGSIPPNTSNM